MLRREFLESALTAGAASLAGVPVLTAQQHRHTSIRSVRVEALYQVPGMPNALEAESDGLWVGCQIDEIMYKVDYDSGTIIRQIQTESHNTSGLGVGGGHLWLGANGATRRRPERPTDRPFGELLQADLNSGRTVRAHRPVWGGGIHGVTYAHDTNTVWVTALSIGALAELDPHDDFRILKMIRNVGNAAHGIALYDGSLWCAFSGELSVKRINPENGQVIEVYQLTPDDPDQHGMTIHEGYCYYCDAGEGGSRPPSPGSRPGYICRFEL
jgi:hypothetical protein